jgi:hypothetical protein
VTPRAPAGASWLWGGTHPAIVRVTLSGLPGLLLGGLACGLECHAAAVMDEDLDVTSTFLREKSKRVLSELHDSQVFRIVQIDQDLLRRLAEDIAQFKKDGA